MQEVSMRLRTANTVLTWLMVGVLLWPSSMLHSCCCAAHAAVQASDVTPAKPTGHASATLLRPCCQKRAARQVTSIKQTDAPLQGSVTVQRVSSHRKQQPGTQWQARCCCDEARSATAQGVGPSRVRLLLKAPQELITCGLFTAPHDIAHRELGDPFHSVPGLHPAPPDLRRLCRWLA